MSVLRQALEDILAQPTHIIVATDAISWSIDLADVIRYLLGDRG